MSELQFVDDDGESKTWLSLEHAFLVKHLYENCKNSTLSDHQIYEARDLMNVARKVMQIEEIEESQWPPLTDRFC
ncbi:MAG: hypothetical protein EOO38_00245 [Cytophagaceae bacterium]|nr:MAG: hypothetical protein EOO38_00245 [Cytophagaceae bacterium]